jgi:hypothetical protein
MRRWAGGEPTLARCWGGTLIGRVAKEKPSSFVVVGNPGSRRVLLFQEALLRRGLSPARLVSYADLLAGRASLAPHLSPGDVVRIESPGKSLEVERALIALGAEAMEKNREPGARIDPEEALALSEEKGRIRYPRQGYLGFRELCGRLAGEIAGAPGVSVMNSPGDIVIMFDKRLCHARFMAAGIPVPRSLGDVRGWDDLLQKMRAARARRVFVKLAHGSSASGVVALREAAGGFSAITSVERIRRGGETILFNSRSIRHYTRPDEIADIVGILCREGAQVEAWLPKAKIAGKPFDVRVVTIAGAAAHFVARIGNSPMTNLHLGNPRGDAAALLEAIGPEAWEEAKSACERAAAEFPASLYTGVDLLIAPRPRPRVKHAILEINAFGDLLPGVLHAGMDTYGAEIEAVLRGPRPV